MPELLHRVKHESVTSCIEASKARGIKLKQELKTILVAVNDRKVAIHIRGCDRVNIRAIKKTFKQKDICFVNEHFLNRFGLSTGIINPWNIPFCNYHLVCLKVFNNRFMGTNNSQKTEGVLFLVEHIFNFNNLIFGHFGI